MFPFDSVILKSFIPDHDFCLQYEDKLHDELRKSLQGRYKHGKYASYYMPLI